MQSSTIKSPQAAAAAAWPLQHGRRCQPTHLTSSPCMGRMAGDQLVRRGLKTVSLSHDAAANVVGQSIHSLPASHAGVPPHGSDPRPPLRMNCIHRPSPAPPPPATVSHPIHYHCYMWRNSTQQRVCCPHAMLTAVGGAGCWLPSAAGGAVCCPPSVAAGGPMRQSSLLLQIGEGGGAGAGVRGRAQCPLLSPARRRAGPSCRKPPRRKKNGGRAIRGMPLRQVPGTPQRAGHAAANHASLPLLQLPAPGFQSHPSQERIEASLTAPTHPTCRGGRRHPSRLSAGGSGGAARQTLSACAPGRRAHRPACCGR